MFIFAIAAILTTLPLWGGMILVSSIATLVFAEALKKKSDWALWMQRNYEARSVWFGPIVALGCALLGLVIMLTAGVRFEAFGVIMLVVFGGLAFWFSKRAALSIMRWRMADCVKS